MDIRGRPFGSLPVIIVFYSSFQISLIIFLNVLLSFYRISKEFTISTIYSLNLPLKDLLFGWYLHGFLLFEIT